MKHHHKQCDKCDGSGLVPSEHDPIMEVMCDDCEGSGEVEMTPEEVAEHQAMLREDAYDAAREDDHYIDKQKDDSLFN
jgi:DnaJ-class molecular chaperone